MPVVDTFFAVAIVPGAVRLSFVAQCTECRAFRASGRCSPQPRGAAFQRRHARPRGVRAELRTSRCPHWCRGLPPACARASSSPGPVCSGSPRSCDRVSAEASAHRHPFAPGDTQSPIDSAAAMLCRWRGRTAQSRRSRATPLVGRAGTGVVLAVSPQERPRPSRGAALRRGDGRRNLSGAYRRVCLGRENAARGRWVRQAPPQVAMRRAFLAQERARPVRGRRRTTSRETHTRLGQASGWQRASAYCCRRRTGGNRAARKQPQRATAERGDRACAAARRRLACRRRAAVRRGAGAQRRRHGNRDNISPVRAAVAAVKGAQKRRRGGDGSSRALAALHSPSAVARRSRGRLLVREGQCATGK
ncbi:hypothetical protein ERJ75_000807900 [Trypanosoma vivax]|uniref:Uncharacterized protein n=1 Tax=Trypanosoma vivax (strain Y486) TaxID=1055687 RepID=F9WML4_TRYVY|nr:hypothetical protein ERJ75_000807900 [Trypanosoma vivax]CCD18771.1 hypothetical protein, conserved in T. vivax [Trypanosoma vivax Y486]|eukprot:CCD18771.1 hypothetical protein, conserved in T. vivax [Trypanosoma vivax Y486]